MKKAKAIILALIAAAAMGAKFPVFDMKAVGVFAYICTASIASYTLWYYVLGKTELSKLFIIKFAEPLFACVFGAVLLGENIFKVQYLIAFVLICIGIIIGHHTKKECVKK